MKVYLSHAMRGKAGEDASRNTQAKNCAAAIEVAWVIRNVYGRKLDLYVPAETEPFVQTAHDVGYLSVGEILEIDCKVIDMCEAVIVWVPEGGTLQGGRLIEYNYALTNNKPVIVFTETKQAVSWLEHFFTRG